MLPAWSNFDPRCSDGLSGHVPDVSSIWVVCSVKVRGSVINNALRDVSWDEFTFYQSLSVSLSVTWRKYACCIRLLTFSSVSGSGKDLEGQQEMMGHVVGGQTSKLGIFTYSS